MSGPAACYDHSMPDALLRSQPLSRAEYDRMVERGDFDDERIELLRGDLVPKDPQSPWHADVVAQFLELLVLVIEVADSSLAKDRDIKAALYAECGVPEYWIVNLPEQVIEVRTEPHDGAYRKVEIIRRGDVLAPLAFPDVRIFVDDIL